MSSDDQESETLNDIYENGLACGVNDLVYDSSLNTKYPFLDFKEEIFSPSTESLIVIHLFILWVEIFKAQVEILF